MIKLTVINQQVLNKELMNKVDGVAALKSPSVMEPLNSAIYKITRRQFIIDTNKFAMANPTLMHHVYEWNHVGQNRARLFELVKISGGVSRVIIGHTFRDSRTPVPIHPLAAEPGPTGKFVSKRHIFAKKAEMMEYGRRASFIASKNVVLPSDAGLVFRSKGTRISIPPSTKTRLQFTRFIEGWYSTRAQIVVNNSRIMDKIEKSVATALNRTGTGKAAAVNAAIQIIKGYEAMDNV